MTIDIPRLALKLSAPEVPARATLVLIVVAEALAENVQFWGVPGVTLRVEGEAVTPAGRPLA
jgi:hypothetical protein